MKSFLHEVKKGPWSFKVNKIQSLYIEDKSLDKFAELILGNFKVGIRYSVLFRVKYDFDRYGMLGHQVGLYIKHNKDIDSVNKLHKDLNKMMKHFMSRYHTEEIEQLEMLYIVLEDKPALKLKNIDHIKLNRNFVRVKESKAKFNDDLLPLTMDTSYFGKLLIGDERNSYFSLINEQKELLNQDEINIDNIDSVYLYNRESIVVNRNPVNNLIVREIYSAYTGGLENIVNDKSLDKNKFSRKIGNLTLIINKSKEVISTEGDTKLKIIEYNPYKDYEDVSNPYIGSFDLETFKDLDSLVKIYAVGFMILGKEPETFYLDKNQTSNDLLLNCLNLMLDKYNGYIFYTHNFGKYDSIFVLNILKKANKELGYDYYELDPLWRDGKLLKLGVKIIKKPYTKRIKKYGISIRYIVKLVKESENNIKNIEKLISGDYSKVISKYSKITFVDSYNLLNGRLYDLSHSFGIDVTKGHFPHKFVNKGTLNYIGNTPSIEYWASVSGENISKNEYKELFKKDWCLKDECIVYLKKDLESLLKIMNTFDKYIIRKYGTQMTKCYTISRLALNIFIKHYLKNSKLPLINKPSIYNDIKEAYYGGITDVYKPYGKKLLLYDVNSLYPFASLNPMPGNKCTFLENFSIKGLYLNDLFGFFYSEIEVSNNYLGLLPVRTDEGLITPNGKWYGWYFSEELKFAQLYGYKIQVIKGYNFNREENVFNEFVNTLYNLKAISIGAIKVIVKMLLNSLIGRFGMNINKPITEIVDINKLMSIWETREFEGPPKELVEDEYIVTYYPEISKEICESHGLDYNKVLKSNKNVEKSRQMIDVSLSTAAAVTSYARIFMSKIKLDILNKGGHVYYTDTDSIVVDIPLDENLVGLNLGQFKLEYEIKEGYFISAKTYCLVLKDNSLIIKTKGLYNHSLSLKDFKNLYKGIPVKGIKMNTITIPNEGSVELGTKYITLDPYSYKKRMRVYKFNKWIDTKPIILNSNKLYENKSNRGKNIKSSNKLLINNTKKRNFSTYIYKSIKICKRYVFKKFIDKIIDILVYIFIIFLLSIIFLVYFLYFQTIDFNVNDITNELELINYKVDNIELTNSNFWKQKLESFVDLFKDDKNIYNIKTKFSSNLIECPNFNNKQNLIDESLKYSHYKLNIIDKLHESNYQNLEDQIQNLKEENSLLKIQIQKYKIKKIDDINFLDKMINEINVTLNMNIKPSRYSV